MPKYSKDTTTFDMKVTDDDRQLKITVPRVLYQRLQNAESIVGSFVLSDSIMKLKEEYQVVTPEQLCSRFWAVPGIESKEGLDALDWDDLLMRIGVELHNQDNKSVVISDWDSTTYDQFHVTFQVE